MKLVKIDREYNDLDIKDMSVYFIHPMETKKPLKSQPSKYGKNVN